MGTGGGAQIDKGGRAWCWLCSPLASVSLYLAVALALLLALYVCGNGDALWASRRFASPSSSTVEATTSCGTNWAVRGNWADTGDLNTLESFSLHRVTWMVSEPMEGVLMGGDVICEHGEWEVV